MMIAAFWIFAALSLSLPAEFKPRDDTSERIQLPGPPGQSATQTFRSWTGPSGKSVYLFYWEPRAPRDLGPMQVQAKWPARVAGQPTEILETSLFMGWPQRVFVVHLGFRNPDATAMIYASGMERVEFEAIVAGATRK
jgi:hypothetical protein